MIFVTVSWFFFRNTRNVSIECTNNLLRDSKLKKHFALKYNGTHHIPHIRRFKKYSSLFSCLLELFIHSFKKRTSKLYVCLHIIFTIFIRTEQNKWREKNRGLNKIQFFIRRISNTDISFRFFFVSIRSSWRFVSIVLSQLLCFSISVGFIFIWKWIRFNPNQKKIYIPFPWIWLQCSLHVLYKRKFNIIIVQLSISTFFLFIYRKLH